MTRDSRLAMAPSNPTLQLPVNLPRFARAVACS
jgi:hypothetical protein